MSDNQIIFAAILFLFLYKCYTLGMKWSLEEKRLRAGNQFDDRLERLEKRIENLETIVIEQRKKEEIDQL